MKAQQVIKQIQQLLKDSNFYLGEIDGIPGKKTLLAFQECTDKALEEFHSSQFPSDPTPGDIHHVIATSFADPKDIAKFYKCKADGNSDNFCFKKGDNGIGVWGDDTTANIPICALPPEDWIEKWQTGRNARGKKLQVIIGGKSVVCQLRDTMPHKENITNGAGIDLNPSALAVLGLKAPLKTPATWQWV